MKVRTRIMIAFIVTVTAGFLYLLNRVDQSVRPIYLESIEDDMLELATVFSSDIARRSQHGEIELEGFRELVSHAIWRRFEALIYDAIKTRVEFGVYVTDARGIVLFDSTDHNRIGEDYSGWNDVARTLDGEYGARATWQDSPDGRIQMFYVASPVEVDGRILGVVTVYKPTTQGFGFFQKVREEAFQGVLIASLLVLFWGFLIGLWVNRPIQQLTEYSLAVRDGRRAAVPNLGRGDMGMLAKAFDEMRDAIEGKSYVEQYVQTLTHEIKSPISAIRGAAELLEEEMPEERRLAFIANIRGETRRIQHIVDRLLELSAIENRRTLRNLAQVDLVEVLSDILDEAGPRIQSKQIRIAFEPESGFQVCGERFLLRLAFSNLLQNAQEFTPQGGSIRIWFDDRKVFIQDSGPGIPDYALGRIFERFYSLQRPDNGKKSSGLGLSIVRQVAELHQAAVTLRNHPEGGAIAVFAFPKHA